MTDLTRQTPEEAHFAEAVRLSKESHVRMKKSEDMKKAAVNRDVIRATTCKSYTRLKGQMEEIKKFTDEHTKRTAQQQTYSAPFTILITPYNTLSKWSVCHSEPAVWSPLIISNISLPPNIKIGEAASFGAATPAFCVESISTSKWYVYNYPYESRFFWSGVTIALLPEIIKRADEEEYREKTVNAFVDIASVLSRLVAK